MRWYVMTAVVMALLVGCDFSGNTTGRWELYQNSRYGFEFPYPAEWVPGIEPANRDGQVFTNPHNADIQMRSWASHRVQTMVKPEESNGLNTGELKKNFTTYQGKEGNLSVNIGPQISSITLTLLEADIEYKWRGESPNQLFSQYYQLFYRVAGQYKITEKRGKLVQLTAMNRQ